MSARVSAKTGQGVHDMFKRLIIAIHDKLIKAHHESAAAPPGDTTNLSSSDSGAGGGKKGGCC